MSTSDDDDGSKAAVSTDVEKGLAVSAVDDNVQTKPESDDQSARDEKPAQATSSATESITERRRFGVLRARAVPPAFTHARGNEQFGEEYLVEFDGPTDPYCPLNWHPRKKLTTLIIYSNISLGTVFNSAIFESAAREVAADYHVGLEVATLGTTLTLLGFALGPLFWAPLSEVYGRKWVVLAPYFVAACFAFGCGASDTIQSILITRFFQGLFSSSVLANMGGMLADIYTPKERGPALVAFSLSVVSGPLTAPVVGSAIAYSYLHWRWVMYIVGILQMATAALGLLVLDETYAPVLLARKAQTLRLQTGNWALHAKHEMWNASFRELARKYLVRPFQLMVNPVCLLMSFYASFVYALIYGSLAAVPVIFGARPGWTPVEESLPFLALLLGCFAGLFASLANTKPYIKAVVANGGKPVPEARLYPMMLGSVLMAAGLFVLAWTGNYPGIVWIAPCTGLFLIGCGFFPIFQASVNYIVDSFLPVAASALATTTFLRSILAAVFPLFMGPMLSALGVGWGLSILGFVGVAMLPVPYLFFAFGARIRAAHPPLKV